MDGTQPPTTPTGERPHGSPPRGLAGTPASPISSGRFGRMFRHLPVYSPKISSLEDLGRKMIQELEDGELDKPLGIEDDDENTAELDNGELRLPAGYTYFGQFVDHDITFDPVSSLTRQNDPDGLEDFRTPRFDLDSLYGRGPADQPYLYEKDGVHLQPGEKVSTGNERVEGPDLQRNANERALVGDPRNDENLIVSQLQATFLKFHNGVLDQVAERNSHLEKDDIFKLAQKEVRWHYQWVVVHDFLARLVGQEVVDDILRPEPYATPTGAEAATPVPRLRFYRWNEQPYMPVEFSVAAYRFGHSMIRPSYKINDVAETSPAIDGVSRIPIFPIGENDGPRQSLKGFRKLESDWGVQWRFFLDGIEDGLGDDPNLPQPGYKLDAQLSNPLGTLPKSTAGPEDIGTSSPTDAQDLAIRNLIRGKMLGLPSGQDVARAMGIEPLGDDELFNGVEIGEPAREDLADRAPLWFYVLKEAEVRAGSAHLGPVGGRIVAEVLIGLLAGDPLSYLGVQPNWKPTLKEDGGFTLSDLINIAVPAPEAQVPPPYSP
ncbi:MAG TPA: heme peroxidase family protein [Solirubrobacterales bacterium]|nr:heme peroxidase family protein [Solirubrobacterales bacterium]